MVAITWNYLTKQSGTAVNCEEEGHCLHEGTAVGSMYCCKCGKYIQISVDRSTYAEFVRRQMAMIDANPQWGVKYL